MVRFLGVDMGLTTKNGKPPTCFELSEDGKKFVAAVASIQGEKVIVSSDQIKKPQFVRMGWHDSDIPNLMDKNGWPVFSFPAQSVR